LNLGGSVHDSDDAATVEPAMRPGSTPRGLLIVRVTRPSFRGAW
jgi:hypothetical protein